MSAALDDLFESTSIYKTLVIAGSEDDMITIATHLRNADHSVTNISEDLLDDERPLFLSRLEAFRSGSARVLCVSTAVWLVMKEHLEAYAMTHNLLVLYHMDDHQKRMILDWLHDARSRGFKHYGSTYHVVFEDEENFLPDIVEEDD
jgi:superfamily II DNA/RNA helicase